MRDRDGVAVLQPFLGVSSLDFGPLPHRGGLFRLVPSRLAARDLRNKQDFS